MIKDYALVPREQISNLISAARDLCEYGPNEVLREKLRKTGLELFKVWQPEQPDQWEALMRTFKILESEEVWWTVGEDENLTLRVNCNDVFAWGLSDSEEIDMSTIEILEQAQRDLSEIGKKAEFHVAELYCARVRGLRPQLAYYDNIEPSAHALFDACGSEEDQFGTEAYITKRAVSA